MDSNGANKDGDTEVEEEKEEEEEEAVPRGGGYRIYGCWKPSTSEGEEREPRERPVKVY